MASRGVSVWCGKSYGEHILGERRLGYQCVNCVADRKTRSLDLKDRSSGRQVAGGL